MRKLTLLLVVSSFFFLGTMNSEVLGQTGSNSKTHLGGFPSALVQLVHSPTPLLPGGQSSFDFRLLDDGSGIPFNIPKGQILVIMDAVVNNPTSTSGTYGVFIGNTPFGNTRLSLVFDTNVEGFQKTVNLGSGLVFSTLPRVLSLGSNPGSIVVTLYGHLAMDK